MKVSTSYHRTNDTLLICLKREDLRFLLLAAKSNFFEFLYNSTEFYFYRKKTKLHFGMPLTKEFVKISKAEAEDVYKNAGFQSVITKLEDKKYHDLFTNYDIILNIDKKELADVLINDFKLLLDIANMSLATFKEYSDPDENK